MSELAVVFVAFDGVQPIDVVGPHEVIASAGDAAASLGRRGGYRVRVASVRGGLVRTESGLELGTVPLPGPGERIDTLVLPGGTGSRAARARRRGIDERAPLHPRVHHRGRPEPGAVRGAGPA